MQVTNIIVPDHIKVGESGWLICEYSEIDDNLYSLSWYLGMKEFYKWIPSNHIDQVTTHDIENVFKVDPHHSTDGKVQLHEVTLMAAGKLRCEVSY